MFINLVKFLKVTALVIAVALCTILTVLLCFDLIPGPEVVTGLAGIVSLIALVREIKPRQQQLHE